MLRLRRTSWALGGALLAGTLGIACTKHDPTSAGGAATVRFAIQIAGATTPQTFLGITVVYLDHGAGTNTVVPIPLASARVPVQAATARVPITIDLTSCLADASRLVPGPRCSLQISVELEQNGAILDSVAAPTVAASPGETIQLTPTLTVVAIGSVIVSPALDTLLIPDSVQLADSVIDEAGHVVTGHALRWSSSDTTVATVDSVGLVRTVRVGTTQVTVSTGRRQSTSHIVVGAAPTLVLVRDTAVIRASANGPLPPVLPLGISSSSTKHWVANLAVAGITYAAGEPSGWLQASLDRTVTPATLTLTATQSSLAPAHTYTATILLTGAAGVTTTLTVSYTIGAAELWVGSTGNLTPPSAPDLFGFTANQLGTSGSPTPAIAMTIGQSSTVYPLSGGGLAFDAQGDLWETLGLQGQGITNPARLLAYTPTQLASGGLQTPAVTIIEPPGATESLNGDDIAFDGAGTLWNANITPNGPALFGYSPSQLATGGQLTPAHLLLLSIAPAAGSSSVAFDAHGNLWVLLYASDSTFAIATFSPTQLSAASGSIAPTQELKGPAHCGCQALGLAFDPAGNVWIGVSPVIGTAATVSQLYMYAAADLTTLASNPSPTPRVIVSQSSSVGGPWGLAFDASGNLWVGDGLSFGQNTALDNTVQRYPAANLVVGGSGQPDVTITLPSLTGAQALGLAIYPTPLGLPVQGPAALRASPIVSRQPHIGQCPRGAKGRSWCG